jgi:hypothetical protein
MTNDPVDKPETIPLASTVARSGLEELHTPPVPEADSSVAAPVHTDDAPVILPAKGAALTVTITDSAALPIVYAIVVVPGDKPKTIPVVALTVATTTLVLLQVPPGVAFPSVVVAPVQTESVPVMGPDVAVFTVMILVVELLPHALVTVYEMVTVPAVTPVTRPVDETVALLLSAVQVPPGTLLVSEIFEASLTADGPEMTPADGAAGRTSLRPGVN